MEVDELFPVAETLQMLRFAEMEGGDIHLTEAGKRFALSEIDERKRLFAQQLVAYVPLAAHIRRDTRRAGEPSSAGAAFPR